MQLKSSRHTRRVFQQRMQAVTVAAGLLISGFLLIGCQPNTTKEVSNPPAPTKPETVTPPPSSGKLYIESGGRPPRPDFVRANIAKMEQRPFDGLSVALNAIQDDGASPFRKTAYPESAFIADREDLAATRFSRFKHNFVRVNCTPEDGWNWFDEGDWNAARSNIRQIAKTASAGRFEGLIFDAEPYGNNPWRYEPQRYPGQDFATVSAKVRERGRSFMTVIQNELPRPQMLLFWGLGIVRAQAEESGSLERADYALLAPFLNGWMDAIQPGAQVIDANEGAYYYLDTAAFDFGRDYVKGATSLLSAENRVKTATQWQFGSTVYMDLLLDLFDPAAPDCADWCGVRTPHFMTVADRLRLL
jgi:hypothetical protein